MAKVTWNQYRSLKTIFTWMRCVQHDIDCQNMTHIACPVNGHTPLWRTSSLSSLFIIIISKQKHRHNLEVNRCKSQGSISLVREHTAHTHVLCYTYIYYYYIYIYNYISYIIHPTMCVCVFARVSRSLRESIVIYNVIRTW